MCMAGQIAVVFALIIVASIVPVLRGAPRRSFLFFTPGAEVYLGRWAMLVRVRVVHTFRCAEAHDMQKRTICKKCKALVWCCSSCCMVQDRHF